MIGGLQIYVPMHVCWSYAKRQFFILMPLQSMHHFFNATLLHAPAQRLVSVTVTDRWESMPHLPPSEHGQFCSLRLPAVDGIGIVGIWTHNHRMIGWILFCCIILKPSLIMETAKKKKNYTSLLLLIYWLCLSVRLITLLNSFILSII